MEHEIEESSLLDYARFHGLAIDHTLEDDDIFQYRRPSSIELLSDLGDPEDAPAGGLPKDFTIAEKLSLDVDARSFLASVILLQNSTSENLLSRLDIRSRKHSKIDLPLLRTDHELDVTLFKRHRVEEDFWSDLQAMEVDEENDEGLSWPVQYDNLPAFYSNQCEGEKLEASKECMLWLQSTLSVGTMVDDLHERYETELSYTRVSKHCRKCSTGLTIARTGL